MRKSLSTLIIFTAMIILAACGATPPSDEDGVLTVVTTTGQVADIAINVGGDLVSVDPLLGPGADPHLFVAKANDVSRLQDAEIILYNGLFLEAQLEDILEQIAEEKPSVPVTQDISESDLLPSEDYDDEFDPHIWFDVSLWIQATETVRDVFSAADPDNAGAYADNAAAYIAELNDVDAYIRSRVEEIPADKRVLITAHDAFNYFGNSYGFEVMGLQGISTASEASTADVQALADFIADNEIPAIFIESSVPIRNVEAVQAAVNNRGFDVVIGGELFSDAMGDAGTPEGTYIGMVRHNIDTIADALSQ